MDPMESNDSNGRGAKNQVRVRGPRPQQSVSCQSLTDLDIALRDQLDETMQSLVPELIHSQFQFSVDVSLPISGMADEIKDSYGFAAAAAESAAGNDEDDQVLQLSVASAVAHLADAKLKLKRQRAVSREILKTIQAVDGFRYLEKEAWDTKHFDGYRFKYLCRDSYQNKDRVSNRARTAAASDSPGTAAVPKPEKEGRDNRLPTYDCRGSIFIKFSLSQGLVDVIYQHFPIHRESMPVAHTKKRSREDSPAESKYETPANSFSAINSSVATPSNSTPQSMSAMPFSDTTKPPKGKKRKQSIPKSLEMVEDNTEEEPISHEDGNEQADTSGTLTPIMASFDIPSIPPSLISPQLSHDPGDGDFFQPSVVTRVPGLAAQMKYAILQSYSTSTSTDPSTTTAAAQTTPASAAAAAAAAAKKDKKKPAPAKDSFKPSKPRMRTKTGCYMCRTRKLKCDEGRPVCGACARSREKRECEFPGDDPERDAAEELK